MYILKAPISHSPGKPEENDIKSYESNMAQIQTGYPSNINYDNFHYTNTLGTFSDYLRMITLINKNNYVPVIHIYKYNKCTLLEIAGARSLEVCVRFWLSKDGGSVLQWTVWGQLLQVLLHYRLRLQHLHLWHCDCLLYCQKVQSHAPSTEYIIWDIFLRNRW